MTALVVPDGPDGRATAVETLRAGRIVAIPTDTVYGLAVDLRAPDGIERLFRVKRRPPDKGIVLLLADAAQASEVAVLTPSASVLAGAFWPGGLTLVLPQRADARLPAALTGGEPTVGVRVADHEAPRTIARALGPLPVTSANISGRPEATTAAEILAVMGDDLDVILDGGPAPGGRPSTVVDGTGDAPRILRAGAIDVERIARTLDAAGFGLATT
jgi:L-threonylcarbamoyladenylate synthase